MRRSTENLRFELRGVLAVVAIIALAFTVVAGWRRDAAREDEAAKQLEDADCLLTRESRRTAVFCRWLGVDCNRVVAVNAIACALSHEMIDNINRLRHLKTLRFRGNSLGDEDFHRLSPSDELRDLDVGGTCVTGAGLTHVRAFPNLTTLNLSSLAISDEDLRPIADMQHLAALDVSGSKITCRGVAYLTGMSSLRELWLGYCPLGDSGRCTNLGGLGAIEILDLRGTGIRDAGVSNLRTLKSLRVLWLGGCELGDVAVEAVAQLKELAFLDLSGAEISGRALTMLGKLVNLCHLDLEDATITDGDFSGLQQLHCLRRLNLSGVSINEDERVFKYLASLQNLQYLYLARTEIADANMVLLSKLPNLYSLDLREAKGVQSHCEDLVMISTLIEIDLRGVAVTRQDIATLRHELPACNVEWDGRKHRDVH